MSALVSKAWPTRFERARSLAFAGTKWTLFWFGMVFLAAFLALVIDAIPMFTVIPPVLALSWLFCRRYPVPAFGALFLLSGGFWSIEQYTHLPTGPAADALLVGLWIAGIQALIAEDRPGVKRLWPGAVAAMILCFVTFLFIFRADDAYPALYTWRLSFWYIAAALLLAYVPLRRGGLWQLTRVALVVIFLVSGYALFRWVVGPGQAERGFVDAVGTRGYESINGQLRLFGSMGGGHILSLWMAPLTVFCFALVLGLRGPWRIFALVTSGMCAAALVGTEVRAGEAAAGIALVFVVFIGLAADSLGARRLAAIGLATLAAGVGLAVIIETQAGKGTENSKRFEAILNPENDYSFQTRRFKWATVLASIKDKPIGDGLGTSGDAAARYARFQSVSSNEVDSSYLTLAVQLGFTAMLLFGFVLILLLLGFVREAIEGTDPLRATLALAAAGTLIAYAIQLGFGLYIEGISGLGIWLVIGLGMRAVSRREPAAG